MNNREETNSRVTKLAIVSLITSLLGLLSFFLMFNWTAGEFLTVPTLLFGFASLIVGIIAIKQMRVSGKKDIVISDASMIGFGILIGFCILVFFCVALFLHY